MGGGGGRWRGDEGMDELGWVGVATGGHVGNAGSAVRRQGTGGSKVSEVGKNAAVKCCDRRSWTLSMKGRVRLESQQERWLGHGSAGELTWQL